MMTNLFSMFDPANFSINSSWMILIISISMPVFKMNSKQSIILLKMINSLKKEFFNSTSSKISNNLLIPIFMMILMANMMSLIPSSFAATAQMSFVLPLSMPMWLSSIMMTVIFKTNKFLSHLVPSGTPTALMPALTLIEMTSNLIRPITLTVRLVANITAGHLLIHLLSSFSCKNMMNPCMTIMIILSMILMMLEIGVAFIQSYIMCTLISLYSSEIK